jgi:hypothetical protein
MDRVVRDYKLFSRVKLGLLGTSDQSLLLPLRLDHDLYSSFLWRRGTRMRPTERGGELIVGWTLELAYV